ncbi:hypothetical protein [Blastococcus montanus]|uniref:hypothetical protein n=1 Tax=Blastococcus montanus TaxID=3144973 RepID=UPI00320924C1
MNRTGPRSPAPLPPVTLTPEEAAAVAAALAARPDGPYAEAGQAALEKVLAALEPDPRRRARLLAAVARVGGARRPGGASPRPGWAGSGEVARSGHPAGRALRPGHEGPRSGSGAAQPPRLVVLPGGRA